jgi:hypothetical protein
LQTTPQAPQLFASLDVLVHVPLHNVCPEEQEGATHVPAVQVSPDAHTWPQAPQLFASLDVLVHVPLHSVCPEEQEGATHVPAVQVSPDAHTWPQEPQLLGSEARLKQPAVHEVVPDGQVHTAAVQVAPDLQTTPHAPQLLASVSVLVHVPPHDDCPDPQAVQTPPTQFPVWQFDPEVHADPFPAAAQAPLTHGNPLPQALPQVPQLEGSVVVASQYVPQSVPGQLSVSPAAPILYSTSRFASAPVFVAQVEPVRRIACRVAPPAKVITMAPVSDQ